MTDAERARRYRRRRRRNEFIVPLPVDFTIIDQLIDAGCLEERASEDRTAVAAAIRQRITGNFPVTRDATKRR